MKNVEKQIRLIGEFQIECVLIGGVAATVHGSSIPTQDLDVCYSRERPSLTRIVAALRSVNATLRGAPKDLPFILDEETLRHGLYSDCLENADEAEVFGYRLPVLSLDKLMASKQAAGRAKDLIALVELEAIKELKARGENP